MLHNSRAGRAWSLWAALLLACVGPSFAAAQAPRPAVPRFVEETAASGLASRYEGGWEFTVGGGVASFDCNDDGLPDLYLAGGSARASLYRNGSRAGGPLRFTKADSGLEMEAVTGAYPLDIDGDGRSDLAVLRVGETVLMRGLGECRFERANERWSFQGGDAWTTAFAATWERGLPWPTLALGRYVDRTQAEFPWGNCGDNQLFRPQATGRAFAAPVALKPSYCALSMLFTNWSGSGEPALRVSNDREYYKGGQEQLWRLPSGAAPSLFTEADGWKRLQIWGMGIASADLNGDGLPEYFLSSMADNKLQVLAGDAAHPTYQDAAFARGVTAQRPYTGGDVHPSTAWHAQFEDLNNDGWLDLFIAKGNIADMPDFAAKDPNDLLLGREDGNFVEVGDEAGLASFGRGRGAAVVDLNADGLLDVVVVNRSDDAQVWRNLGSGSDGGHWLQLRLRQDGANRDAVGGRVEVRLARRLLSREVIVGGGHASGRLGWLHVGLGEASSVRVRAIWPDGSAGAWSTLAADHFYGIDRTGPVSEWHPGG